MLAYQICRNRKLTAQDLNGRRCYIGIDLASTTDIAVMAILYPPHGDDKWTLVCCHYLPEEKILDGGSTRYKAWHSEGWITATPGNVIDYEFIEDDLKSIRDTHQIVKVAFDPFQATQFSTRMQSEGLPMVQYGATVKNFSSPMKELEAMIMKKKIQFQSDPVLQWMFSNVVAKVDKKENIFPDKERRESKIDGVVAAIMALGLAMSETITVSPYEERGVRVV
jgi:phage terminase large subunit-like protein